MAKGIVVKCEAVIKIDGNVVMYQFNQNSAGARTVTRSVKAMNDASPRFIEYRGMIVMVRFAGEIKENGFWVYEATSILPEGEEPATVIDELDMENHVPVGVVACEGEDCTKPSTTWFCGMRVCVDCKQKGQDTLDQVVIDTDHVAGLLSVTVIKHDEEAVAQMLIETFGDRDYIPDQEDVDDVLAQEYPNVRLELTPETTRKAWNLFLDHMEARGIARPQDKAYYYDSRH